MGIYVCDASGRATCTVCNQKIEKGKLNQVVFEAYKSSERCHRSCIVNWESIVLKDYLEKA